MCCKLYSRCIQAHAQRAAEHHTHTVYVIGNDNTPTPECIPYLGKIIFGVLLVLQSCTHGGER